MELASQVPPAWIDQRLPRVPNLSATVKGINFQCEMHPRGRCYRVANVVSLYQGSVVSIRNLNSLQSAGMPGAADSNMSLNTTEVRWESNRLYPVDHPLVDQPHQFLAMTNALTLLSNHCLDGLVTREPVSPLVHGSFLIYRGTLHPTGRIVMVKRLRFATEYNEQATEVSSTVFLAICDLYKPLTGCFPSAFHLVPPQPRKHPSFPWDSYRLRQHGFDSGRVDGWWKRIRLRARFRSRSHPFGASMCQRCAGL